MKVPLLVFHVQKGALHLIRMSAISPRVEVSARLVILLKKPVVSAFEQSVTLNRASKFNSRECSADLQDSLVKN